MMIVSDSNISSVILESSITLLEGSFTLLEASFVMFITQCTVATIVNYDHNMFILEATAVTNSLLLHVIKLNAVLMNVVAPFSLQIRILICLPFWYPMFELKVVGHTSRASFVVPTSIYQQIFLGYDGNSSQRKTL